MSEWEIEVFTGDSYDFVTKSPVSQQVEVVLRSEAGSIALAQAAAEQAVAAAAQVLANARQRITDIVTGPTYTVVTPGNADFYLRITGTSDVLIPDAAASNDTYHINNDFNSSTPSTITSVSIEGSTTVQIYFGESFDLYPVDGVWRLF